MNNVIDARWERDPLIKVPSASADEFRQLAAETRVVQFPPVDMIETQTGYAIDRAWLDELALHTQIVKKRSELAYPHGRLLYSLLRQYIASSGEEFLTIVETGTARGFSALCMSKAIDDAGVDGRIVTLDVLPHLKPIFWNCIDDLDGRKTRDQLLKPWQAQLNRIVFVQGDTQSTLPRVGVGRINFAFLDAQHIRSSVLQEFGEVAARQHKGDVIFFDDVTPAVFPGVVKAVEEIEAAGAYAVTRLVLSEQRAYAWAVKN